MTETGGGPLRFVKMHGAGNDFLMVRGRHLAGPLTAARIARLCDRRKGVGADGLIVLGEEPDGALRMVYFNSDGGEASMCGNGARCTVEFARGLGLAAGSGILHTAAGPHRYLIHGPGDIEVVLPGWRGLEAELALEGCPWPQAGFCDTGVPHLVILLESPAELLEVDLGAWGPVLRGHARFGPAGANVNWVAPGPGSGEHLIRTYERGVEAETLACGTGASAAAVVLSARGLASGPVRIRTRGGDLLIVTPDQSAGGLALRGPAVTSFRGEVESDGR